MSTFSPSLGEHLRRARMEQGISLSEVEAALKIRVRYLQALETDDFTALPPTVYTRALVREYSRFLGLDPGEVLEHGIPMRPQDRNPIRPAIQPLEKPSLISWKAILTVSAIALCTGLFAYLYAQYNSFALSVEVRPSPQPALTPGGRPTSSLLAAAPSPTLQVPATPEPALIPTSGLVIETRITERSWLQVWADGKSVLAETIPAGGTRTFSADQAIRMRVGNAGGVDVTVNGVAQGRLGSPGQVLDASWGRE